MTILCTFPGKYGDLLWALPAMRALSRRLGAPIDLLVANAFGSICPLIEAQPYIDRCVADPRWQTQDTAPISPRSPHREDIISPYAATFHLGYRDWPRRPLPYETLDCLNHEASRLPWTTGPAYGALTWTPIQDEELALTEPWITVEHADRRELGGLVIGFTDEYVELKMGLTFALGNQLGQWITVLAERGSRKHEWLGPCAVDYNLHDTESTWENAAWHLANATVFLGDCSALHVLAVAVGTPVVCMEPQKMRHHPIFWPLGTDGLVLLVKGNDGRPTWDARHVRDVLTAILDSARRTEAIHARHDQTTRQG